MDISNMISEKNQRKAIALLTLSAGDNVRLKILIGELSDNEREEISWYFSLLYETISNFKKKIS